MKKWLSVFTFVLLIIVIMPSTGCASRAIAAEVAQSLIQTNKEGLENIDSEISRIDQQLYDVKVDRLKLEQVLNPALAWVDYQKEIAKPGEWEIKVTQRGLAPMQNERYQVMALEALITRDYQTVTESSYTIKIHDSVTMQTEDGTALHDSLMASQNLLQQNRKAMADARDLSVSTMNNLLKYVNDWKVRKVTDTAYSVYGPGLGWTEQLTSGIWKYDRDTGTLVPDDTPADNLNTVILGK